MEEAGYNFQDGSGPHRECELCSYVRPSSTSETDWILSFIVNYQL